MCWLDVKGPPGASVILSADRKVKVVQRHGVDRVAIVGVGAVGATTAYALLQAGISREIVLVDLDHRRAEGEMMDLRHSVPFASHVAIDVRDVAEVAACDLIIVTAGAAQKAGETRLDLLRKNLSIFESFMPQLAKQNPQAIFLIITNPVDIMTRITLALTGLPPAQVIGSGTVLDSARFVTLLAERCQVTANHINAHVVGEHGDSEVLLWSRAMVGTFTLDEFLQSNGTPLTDAEKSDVDTRVRRAAYEIIERKGSTHFAIGSGAVRLAGAFLHEKQSLYTVSRQMEDVYGLGDVCLSVPTLLNRDGAIKPLALQMNKNEKAAFMQSAEVLDKAYRDLGL